MELKLPALKPNASSRKISTLFSFTTIGDYHRFLSGQPEGCTLAVRHYLAEIRKKSHLNAFLEVFADEALQRARELDDSRKSGLGPGRLHGVVIALKDVISFKGHKLSASSRILEGFTAVYQATAVEKLLAEGAIVIGRNNCDEFAMGSTNENSAFGPVLNAADETRVPGGSSGGSAVAVQAGLCMVSLGSDTGGSVRQPAGFCGLVGLKPTYGRVSRYGLIAYASSFDQIGIFGKNVMDVARVLEVISGQDNRDSTVADLPPFQYQPRAQPERKYRIGYFKEAFEHPTLDREVRSSVLSFTRKLEEEGHLIKGIDFEYLDYIVPAYYVLTTAEASSNLSRYDGVRYGYRNHKAGLTMKEFYEATRSEGFGKEVKRRILLGTFVLSSGYYDAYFTRAQKIRKCLIKKNELIFNDFDIIILPTSPGPAFKIGEKSNDPISMYLADIYTVYANLTGIPALSLPLFVHTNGMPFGLQAMANQFNELLLFQFSELLTQYNILP
jgi:aspartyl-tRNA(Asn)/glutamyl-tRNA(Gln) amidotransferase subunit A